MSRHASLPARRRERKPLKPCYRAIIDKPCYQAIIEVAQLDELWGGCAGRIEAADRVEAADRDRVARVVATMPHVPRLSPCTTAAVEKFLMAHVGAWWFSAQLAAGVRWVEVLRLHDARARAGVRRAFPGAPALDGDGCVTVAAFACKVLLLTCGGLNIIFILNPTPTDDGWDDCVVLPFLGVLITGSPADEPPIWLRSFKTGEAIAALEYVLRRRAGPRAVASCVVN
jgi:hypothetical protein